MLQNQLSDEREVETGPGRRCSTAEKKEYAAAAATATVPLVQTAKDWEDSSEAY